jgi:hypothetical protein
MLQHYLAWKRHWAFLCDISPPYPEWVELGLPDGSHKRKKLQLATRQNSLLAELSKDGMDYFIRVSCSMTEQELVGLP